MARITVKVDKRNVRKIINAVKSATEEGIHDATDDLVRVSSEAAPHDKGILEQSYSKSVGWSGDRVIGVVDYSVKEDNGQNGFNYAYWIHEGDYNLGENSQKKAASGGGTGMSGKSYEVGKQFLTRPLYGEYNTYTQHIQKLVDKAVK